VRQLEVGEFEGFGADDAGILPQAAFLECAPHRSVPRLLFGMAGAGGVCLANGVGGEDHGSKGGG
jgi:hypothetical protein